mmetsp:Transcript_24229/g.29367  ORF Transcript_24229/g.29367 Transcript_24229/m.29367 type:complete len:88 (+) Transcript_24229:154-417(+)
MMRLLTLNIICVTWVQAHRWQRHEMKAVSSSSSVNHIANSNRFSPSSSSCFITGLNKRNNNGVHYDTTRNRHRPFLNNVFNHWDTHL